MHDLNVNTAKDKTDRQLMARVNCGSSSVYITIKV